jgi:hypothetical protein
MPYNSRIADEIKRIQAEPRLPIERKLIGGSLILGVVLLGILIWISHRLFPG